MKKINLTDQLIKFDKNLTERGIQGEVRRGLAMAVLVAFTSLVAFVSAMIGQLFPILLIIAVPASWAIVHKLFKNLGWLSRMYLLIGIVFDMQQYRNRHSLINEGCQIYNKGVEKDV